MNEPIWEHLRQDALPPSVHLRELIFSDPKRAVFRADYLNQGENAQGVLVRLFLEEGKHPRERVNRFLEAKYFEHPNLLRYLDAGTVPSDEGLVTYAVIEQADAPITPPLGAEEALGIAQDVISGLRYLHARNLVYCVLSPENVVRMGTHWKLADFNELRVAGTETTDELLSLASKVDTCPPEAAQGFISPAWDVWSFGQTLRKVLGGYRADMPHPLRAVFLACLNINPSSRPTLDQLSTLLAEARPKDQKHELSVATQA